MLNLARTHDFQVNLSPSQAYPAVVNPPSFNWPDNLQAQQYTLELKNTRNGKKWSWEQVSSPMQLSFVLPQGSYQWRLKTSPTQASKHNSVPQKVSQWIDFEITAALPNYLAPTASELFDQCDGREQWLMYFDEDIEIIKGQCADAYSKLKQTALLSIANSEIAFPKHYRRGQEEGKRQAIANIRLWADRDLITHALLYKIWGEEQHGLKAVERLLQFAEWSLTGPASLLRPCTWGDEVGCSLARNLFLAYHWLSPLLNDSEKDFFIKPMLVRIARQIKERLAQDEFEQYPGHSHTSRLPSYLGIAALALHREHDREECNQWLSYALMIYRGILPFYGGSDGSWVEGPFYASTYSKWHHPFFLSVERLSGFSFYQHPFYQNFLRFARDFIATDQEIHPFGDGFWCRRDGKEWPGFFSQNPLRIYAARFGDQIDYQLSLNLESAIADYRLHLLDVIPTVKQIEFNQAAQNKTSSGTKLNEQQSLNHYYAYAGLGKLTQHSPVQKSQKCLTLYYRASAFGNSSHRHGDQGNIALFDNNRDVLVPTGSFGYRFGSKHHRDWTRQTIAHNLPLLGEQGQKLDDQSAVARVTGNLTESNYHLVTVDLSDAYASPLKQFCRKILLIQGCGLIVVDSIRLAKSQTVNWRLHSPLEAALRFGSIVLTDPNGQIDAYKCQLLSHPKVQATVTHGYEDELSNPTCAIESDASEHVVHLDWQLAEGLEHTIVACCIADAAVLPEIVESDDGVLTGVTIQGQTISIL